MNTNLVVSISLIFLLITGFQAARIRQLPATCIEPPETLVHCPAYFPSWRYDQQLDACVSFVYGGCGRDTNTFATLRECDAICGPNGNKEGKQALSACEQRKKTGPCMGYFPRWYHNSDKGKCEEFIYGGCEGTKNNFESREECEQTCLEKK